ncbi:MAG: putative two-component system response regulator [Chloroflexi bacterium]|nr:MAG: putative two-component system response regulator [Chloroflexota bacterium]MBA4376428.1 hypothetical protein [Anaerolinea sp.]
MFESLVFNRNNELYEYIQLIAYIAEIKEWDNRAHLNRIRGYCQVLSAGLNIPKKDIEIISLASQLHDIGKSVTPDDLLKRKGDYMDGEWKILEKHTSEGASMLSGSTSIILQTGAVIAATHHERWDGSGYPNKLSGDDIPLSGRICALADVFDALVTRRPYKEVVEDKEAVEIVVKSSGKLFDPKCIKVFEKKINEILLIKNSSNGGKH